MSYDEELAFRLQGALAPVAGVTAKNMFGGMAFLLDGHLAIAASGSGGLMVRVDPADSAALIEQEHVSRMEMNGREMAGWLRVADGGFETESELGAWVQRSLDFVRTLPPQ